MTVLASMHKLNSRYTFIGLCPHYFLQLNVLSTVSMEVSYFNLGHNVWEPLLEPSVDPSYENQEVYIPWTLKASVSESVCLCRICTCIRVHVYVYMLAAIWLVNMCFSLTQGLCFRL